MNRNLPPAALLLFILLPACSYAEESPAVATWETVEKPLVITGGAALNPGKGDFSLAMWALSDPVSDRLPGDLMSQYDRAKKRGFHLTLKSNPGATTNQANWRHLQFGIDDDRFAEWEDRGRPGNALLAFALASWNGDLYAGTCEPAKEDQGTVYRYEAPGKWIACGSPDGSNSVMALAEFEGRLYAGTGRYRVAGSALPESENLTPGGRLFRYEGGKKWVDCGQLPGTEAVGGLAVFRGELYATSLYKPAGFFRYEGGDRWTTLPLPSGPEAKTGGIVPLRVEALGVHEGHLYASSYDGGHVYRFDGARWTDCGLVGDNTQTYSFTRFDAALHVGTWPSGRVYRFEDLNRWTDIGRLGEEKEVMGMLVPNGRLLAGSLPLAEVYSYEGGTDWKLTGRLDLTPDVTYRRAWTMAEHGGEVFCSTLPSGKIFACSFGKQVQWGHAMPGGWQHLAAVKSSGRLALYLNGKEVAASDLSGEQPYDLSSAAPLCIGTGTTGPFNGSLRDVRLYHKALEPDSIVKLATAPPRE
jgi:hypothetical protein